MSCKQTVCSSVTEPQPQPQEQPWFTWKMLSGKLHSRWPVNQAFKIIFIKSTANHQKKRTGLTICLQAGLLRIRCLCWSLSSYSRNLYLKSEGHTATGGILGDARTFSGSPNFWDCWQTSSEWGCAYLFVYVNVNNVIFKHMQLLILHLGMKGTGDNKMISSACGWNWIVGADSEMI